MNEIKQAYNSLKNGVEQYVEYKIETCNRDITEVGIITEVLENNKYNVEINNTNYKSVSTIGGSCQLNETVNVLVKQGNYNNLIILKGGASGSGGDIPTKVSQLENDSGYITSNDNVITQLQTKVNTIEEGAEVNVQSDWNVTDNSSDAFIKNKPTIPIVDSSLSTTSENAIQNKAIGVLIPNSASSNNKLADQQYVNDSINSVTAYYVTSNADGDGFATKSALNSATVFYSGGVTRTPTRNDYCIVLADETKDNATTRYVYQGTQWEYQYTVNQIALTQTQLDAINSGINSTLVNKISDLEIIDNLTTQDATKALSAKQGVIIKNSLDGKQANLGFTPIQQGGGTGQLNNKIKIGWSGTRLKAMVDSTDLGNIAFDSNIIVTSTKKTVGTGSTITFDNLSGKFFAVYQAGTFCALGYNTVGSTKWIVTLATARPDMSEYVSFSSVTNGFKITSQLTLAFEVRTL